MPRYRVEGVGVKKGEGESTFIIDGPANNAEEAKEKFLSFHDKVIFQGQITVKEIK